ncbi:alanine:cation symporter family protein [uncultured Methanobrevibacter sp.]|uniref:alanine:cation symporter family protein n=1 Tax=uncultured Methanobrevibacter sp. TaxID=253161 RepID=UPI00262D4E3E|nr:alanine:cation symporter family protein [uncultured Methanobrevibacter sp.]
MLVTILTQIDGFMYCPVLIIVMTIVELYFRIKTKGVQIRLFRESVRLLFEPSYDKDSISSLQVMLVSTASRVETGNIIGVSTTILQ